MANSNQFLTETADTASFAFRAYFRPVVAAARILRSTIAPHQPVVDSVGDRVSLEDARAILRERLAKDRHHEKILLVQGVISALASLLAVAISLMQAFNAEAAVVLAVLIPISIFAVWVTIRLVQNREKIVELKTIRWVINSVDEETAGGVVKQLIWCKPKKKRQRRKDK